MVLDGAIDPSLDLEHLRSGQARGFEKALTSLPRRLRREDALRLPRDGKSVAAFDALMASIDAKPLPAPSGQGRPAASGRASPSSRSSRRSTTGSVAAPGGIAGSRQADGDGSLLLQIADPYQGRKPNGSYSNQHDAYTANTCLDFAAPTDVATYTAWAKRLEASAPHFAGLIAYNDLACAFWPVPAQRDARGDHRHRRSADRGRRHDRRSGHALRVGRGPGRGSWTPGCSSPARARATRRTSRVRACSGRSTSTCSGSRSRRPG